jgi:hypothetical protein
VIEFILFIAGFYCLFNGQFILAILLWIASHQIGNEEK